jgi:hypothetical protein
VALTAPEWKRFYAAERAELGRSGLEALQHAAPEVELPPAGALIFPHTRRSHSGWLVAAAARAVLASGADHVFALGVLHQPEHADAEFCLDGFLALLALAAETSGRSPPRVTTRLAGPDLDLDALRAEARGAALVATADPVHHGIGYGTSPEQALPRDAGSREQARAWIAEQLAALGRGDLDTFAGLSRKRRSDFGRAGPVLLQLLGGRARFEIQDLVLVDYADVLGAPQPTWVAGALVSARPA